MVILPTDMESKCRTTASKLCSALDLPVLKLGWMANPVFIPYRDETATRDVCRMSSVWNTTRSVCDYHPEIDQQDEHLNADWKPAVSKYNASALYICETIPPGPECHTVAHYFRIDPVVQ